MKTEVLRWKVVQISPEGWRRDLRIPFTLESDARQCAEALAKYVRGYRFAIEQVKP